MNIGIEWHTKAAIAGNTRAMCALGTSCLRGQGQEVDTNKAIYWYTLAVNHGDTQAMYLLGRMYLLGENVQIDHAEALKWFTQGAAKGEQQCYFQLGYIYYAGIGVTSNHDTAVEWYTKAAEAGNKEAMYNLGVLLIPKAANRISKIRKTSSLLALIIVAFSITIKLAGVTTLLTLIGCQNKVLPTTPVLRPDGPAPDIKNVKAATTQISGRVGEATAVIDTNNQTLGTTTAKIQVDTTRGRAATPPTATSVFQYWDDIVVQIQVLAGIKAADDKAVQALVDQKKQIGDLSQQLDSATSAQATQQDFWVKQDKNYKAQLAEKDTIIAKLQKSIENALNDKLIWVIIGSIALIGGFVAVGSMLNLPNVTRGGVMAFGTTLAISVLLCQTVWIIKYIAIGVVVIMFAVIIWQIIAHRRAITDLVQTKETLTQLLPPAAKEFAFGHGAIKGQIHDEISRAKGFIEHFEQFVRKAHPSSVPQSLMPSFSPPPIEMT